MRACGLARAAPAGWLVLAAVVVAMAAPWASAIPVTYSTSGIFSASGNNTLPGLTFTGITNNSVFEPTFASLGEFQTSGSGNNAYSGTFTLTITQAAPPGGGPGVVIGSITGTVSGGVSSDAQVTFAPGAVAVVNSTPPVTYDPNDTTNIVPPSTNNGISTLEGRITAVPLPTAAYAGMGLIGALGLFKFQSRRQLAA